MFHTLWCLSPISELQESQAPPPLHSSWEPLLTKLGALQGTQGCVARGMGPDLGSRTPLLGKVWLPREVQWKGLGGGGEPAASEP